VFALAGFCAPSVSTAITVVHLSAHHPADAHEEHHQHGADLNVLWHGHGHDATTPDHDHPSLVAGMQPLRMPAIDRVDRPASVPWHPGVPAFAAAPRVFRSCPPGLACLGPPPPPGRLAILRI
jgi:hypothetical protein